MHILDLIMYFVGLIVIGLVLPRDFKEELGAIVGLFIMVVYTITYIILFAILDYNMVEVIPNLFEKIKW